MVEKGITVGGKTLTEHLEAVNHAEALDFVRSLAGRTRQEISEDDVLDIHHLILQGIDKINAGRYRRVSVRTAGSTTVLPNWVKVPDLMSEFYFWLHSAEDVHPVLLAADAHYKFVSIHPFVDGNGRTARLLMNLLLMQQGYPPALIRPEDRLQYIDALEQAQLGGTLDDYYVGRLLYRDRRSRRTVARYLSRSAGATGYRSLICFSHGLLLRHHNPRQEEALAEFVHTQGSGHSPGGKRSTCSNYLP